MKSVRVLDTLSSSIDRYLIILGYSRPLTKENKRDMTIIALGANLITPAKLVLANGHDFRFGLWEREHILLFGKYATQQLITRYYG